MRTWSETLISELYEIQGYAVWTNVPVGSGKRKTGRRGGGRREADVVAFRMSPHFEIVHAEVGTYWQAPADFETTLRRKFSSSVRRTVVRLVQKAVTTRRTPSYRPIFYFPVSATPAMKKGADRLKGEIPVVFLDGMVQGCIESAEGWISRMSGLITKPETRPALPDSWPLLQFLYQLKDGELLQADVDLR